jgi:fructose-bisphosphate aldolase, class I
MTLIPRERKLRMSIGREVRLKNIFSNPSGNLFGVAIDHFVGYGNAVHGGLANLPKALELTMEGRPDSVTIQPGTAKNLWVSYAGKASLIVQGGCFTVDDRISELITRPIDAIRLGADALAVAIPVRGPSEGKYLSWLTDSVREAAEFNLPVVAHIYPRVFSKSGDAEIVFTPDEIAWAVRCGIETGVDVIKVGYPGDKKSFIDIVNSCPTPIVIAGGPKEPTLGAALNSTRDAIDAGAKGAVVGRNVWGAQDVKKASRAYYSVIHEGLGFEAALASAGLSATD